MAHRMLPSHENHSHSSVGPSPRHNPATPSCSTTARSAGITACVTAARGVPLKVGEAASSMVELMKAAEGPACRRVRSSSNGDTTVDVTMRAAPPETMGESQVNPAVVVLLLDEASKLRISS
eukprot:scaffold10467_cov36-Tisochrysis_lutea.AAC.4